MIAKSLKYYLFWLLGSGIFLSISCIPDFIKKMPTEKRKEYEGLYKQQLDLTRTQFYDLCQDWAQKQGAKIKKQYRQYRRDDERYIDKRDRVLRERLDKADGSNAAKNYLYELLDLQRDMNVTLKVYQIREEEMRHSISTSELQEATEIWNLIDPAHID